MLRTTLGQLAINEALPEELRDHTRVLDGGGIKKLFQEIAEKHPDKYRDIAKRLSDVGRDAAYATGGYSASLEDLRPSPAGERIKEQLRRHIQMIQADTRMDDERKAHAITAALHERTKEMEDTVFEEAKKAGNPLAYQVLSGARGSKLSVKSLLGSDLMYADHHDNPIPVPILHAYPHGLSPVEYWASAFGARKGVAATKFSTQEAGFLAKQLNQISHRLVVTGHDAEEEDRSSIRGLPTTADDPDNEGALLAHPAGPYKRNTVLTPKILKDLQTKGLNRILVRSPMIGGPPQGGVYARDVGVRERGGLAPLGDYVGLAATQALSEKLSQGQLSARHTGGVAGADKAVSGFAHINQLIQVPKTFKGGATHAQIDGKITTIADAPQGGKYVSVGAQQHYVPHGLDPTVKVGDSVEAGDVISGGIPNPAEMVQHKGIGEGRRYFVKAFGDAFKGSGMGSHRRNVELLSRGLIDHVRVTDEFGDHVEDDIVPYSTVEKNWTPRPGSKVVGLSSALGKYLERPVLHHSIGTKIRPGMIPELKEFGVNNLEVHDTPPPFEPTMVRGMYNLQHDPDWMTRHLGSGLEKATLQAAHRGASSDIASTSYVPALAERTHFGRQGLTQGWDPGGDTWDDDDDNMADDDMPKFHPKTPASVRTGIWHGGSTV
jgi:hypothetical protein